MIVVRAVGVVKKHSRRDESRHYDYDHPDEMPRRITHEECYTLNAVSPLFSESLLLSFPRLIFNCDPPTRTHLIAAEVTRSSRRRRRRSVTFLTMRLMDGEIDLVARFVVETSRASENKR